MAESTPPPGTTPPLPSVDAAAIGKLIRDELDRNNKHLEFAQSQIEKDQKQMFRFHQTEELLGWWHKNEGSFR